MNPFKPRRRLPPPNAGPTPLKGPRINSFTVGSWCPDQDAKRKPEAVALSFNVDGLGDIVFRIKTPERVDEVVQMLLRHKRDVWPDAP